MNSLLVPYIAEKALIYLYSEQNLVTEEQMKTLAADLELDRSYMADTLADNRRPVDMEQIEFSF